MLLISIGMKSGPVDINSGLKFIRISCNMTKTHTNIFIDSNSDTLISLAITSTQSLEKSVQHYSDIESKHRIIEGVINQLSFRVTGQCGNEVNIGKIVSDLYIV